MSLEEDLATWIASRPVWQQVAAMRLCRGESFDEAAIAAIADSLIAGEATDVVHLTKEDIPGASVAAGVKLVALKDLAGINALAADQELTFGSTGITVIYGHNASGKSGYARLLKNAVGARVRDDVLGDVFAAGDTKEQHAVVKYVDGINPEGQEWTWSASPNVELQQIHFYDEACGNAYLSTNSQITYQPSALVLLDRLVAVCDAVRAVLEQRMRDSDLSKSALPSVPADTAAARFLTGLKAATSSEEIDAQCEAPTDAIETLSTLLSEEARLKTSEPAKEQNRLRALAGNLEAIGKYCDRVAESLSPQGLEALTKVRTDALELRAAASVASSQSFDSEPVPGVGTATWRALWEAARAYSEAEAFHDHPFPVADAGSRCVLCQQELSVDAAQRLQRFQAFMSDRTERDAAKAEQELESSQQAIRSLAKPLRDGTTATAQIRISEPSLADELDSWIADAEKTCESVVNWLAGTGDLDVTGLEASPGSMLAERAKQLNENAAAIDTASFTESLRAATARTAELQGVVTLSGCKNVIIEEVDRLQEIAKIKSAKKLTDTGAITKKSSDLTRIHVTRSVRDRFTRESEKLRLRHITLDDTSGVKGRLLHRPALLGPVAPVEVTKVLSEGEQTALGLAGFFTEIVFDSTKSAVVLDDPVTSLDHERRSLVARRLVELAADRQVIVFTHEVTFVGDLLRHANEAHVPVTARSIQRKGHTPGICVDDYPWKAKDVGTRISDLVNDLANIKRECGNWNQDMYEERCALWAGKLSETWERAVNLEIVYEVVDRGTSEVRPKKFRILSAITEQDNEEFQAGYGRCSQWARRHDKDPEINFVAPDPVDMEGELGRFRQWHKRIRAYRNG